MISPYMPFEFKRFQFLVPVCGFDLENQCVTRGKLYVTCSHVGKPYFFMYVPDEKQQQQKILFIQKHFNKLHSIKSTLFKLSANKPKPTHQHFINTFFGWQSVNRDQLIFCWHCNGCRVQLVWLLNNAAIFCFYFSQFCDGVGKECVSSTFIGFVLENILSVCWRPIPPLFLATRVACQW